MEKEMEEMKTSYGWPILKMVLLLMFGPPIVYLSWKTSNAIRLSTKRLKEEVIKIHFHYNVRIIISKYAYTKKFAFIILLYGFQKAMDLKKERKKTDALLSEMLPGHIVSMLKLGQEPRPKLYE